MKQQRISRDTRTKQPQVIDERKPNLPEPPNIDPAIANLPLRTIFYMEVGDMDAAHVQLLIQEINTMYEGARGGIHYIIPIRHGKVGSDLAFEAEFLKTVSALCEVQNGQIVLKNGAQDMHVVRHTL